MKLTTRSRYGTRLMLALAEHYPKGPLRLTAVARQQGISVKYLEQIIIPLKKADYIKSVRGPRGGHVLAKPPEEITIWEIVALLETGASLSECVNNPASCRRAPLCPTRPVWREAARAMFEKLQSITLAGVMSRGKKAQEG
jgi:Rrf2 family protein